MNTSSRQLLQIDVSPRGERSHSRQLGREFVAAWQKAHPAGRVVTRDLGANPPPFVTEAWIEGAFTSPEGHSPAARAAIAVSDAYVDELIAATEVVITTPIYNLGIPASLKAWIDQIVRFGRTFTADATGYQSLLVSKKIYVLFASGSDFRPGAPYASYNFAEPHLRGALGFIGLTDIEFVYAHSLSQGPEVSAQAIAEAIVASRKLAIA